MVNSGKKYEYQPDYAIPPGETLQEILEAQGMSQKDLARRTGLATKTINEIIKGKAPISRDTALALQKVLGVTANFWNNLERQYRDALAMIQEQEHLKSWTSWAKNLPWKILVQREFIPKPSDDISLVNSLLRFFQVSNPEAWEETCLKPQATFRSSKAFKSSPEAVAVWLRMGEIEAREIQCAQYSQDKFRNILEEIRSLTTESPDVFQDKMSEQCAQAGVAITFVPEIAKLHLGGATYWLPEGRPVIQLTLRHKRNDHFWFSFFHEAGHILLHGKRDVFLENGEAEGKDEKEQEADRFASDFLIPRKPYRNFISNNRRISKIAVIQFARQLGIAPGIVVGRLQHDHYIPYNQMHDLFVKLFWAD